MIRNLVRPLALVVATLLAACSVEEPAKAKRNIDTLIIEGRKELEAGDWSRARDTFARAHRISPGLRTRMWVLRTWIDEGRNNDVLKAIDDLRDGLKVEGRESDTIELDYLYGMAFAYRARALVASGVVDGAVTMNFLDAQSHLQKVVS